MRKNFCFGGYSTQLTKEMSRTKSLPIPTTSLLKKTLKLNTPGAFLKQAFSNFQNLPRLQANQTRTTFFITKIYKFTLAMPSYELC